MENGKMAYIEQKRKGDERLFREIRRPRKRAIHTTLKPSDITKLEEYGEGKLNIGIEKALEIAESKQYNVKEQLIKIASQIMIDKEMGDFRGIN